MKRIAIIGGGVSGLSAAYALEKQKRKSTELSYVLFEAGPQLGGVIATARIGDFVIEAGPDSFLTEKPWARDLCRELGLGDQLIASNDAERRTYILLSGRLVPLPDGLMFMVPTNFPAAFFSSLFSWPTKLRFLREWFYRPTPDVPESTAAEFIERHYGREMVERVADPLLSGVYGGSADELSASSVLGRFVEIEARQGSLGRAMVAARKLKNLPAEQSSTGQPGAAVPTKPGTARSLFTSLKNGMQSMTDTLAAQIPESERRLNTKIEAVKPEFGKWLVTSSGRTEEFDGVIIAAPAYVASELLRSQVPQISAELEQIRYSSSITVALAYHDKTRESLPPGFGFLVPRIEGNRILACTFVHSKFVNRAPEEHALMRCFLGGSRDEEILRLPDAEITSTVRRELQEILGITADPDFVRVFRRPHAMAQYTVGHKARIDRIRQIVSSAPGLALAGNAYGGIGIPDCIRSGSEAATKLLADLGFSTPPRQHNHMD
ncbi:MAG: protoporphyrinogen oxidase [Terriglobales bacterium]